VNQSQDRLARTLEIVGDLWTLLIVRTVALGVGRFDAIQDELRISRKVLAQRLTALVDSGMVVREAYQDHPVRWDYRLSARGARLVSVVAALESFAVCSLIDEGHDGDLPAP
jgi:DNA-binding HxlR family transcriptional regulator